jgi:phospholipid-transporting ATPase
MGGKSLVERFERFCVNEFDSDRKRNSVLVKDLKTGQIILFIKGADNIIRSRLHPHNSKEYLQKVDNDLQDYSNRGLRTLMLGMKIIDPGDFEVWKAKYQVASTVIENRSKLLNDLAETIEKDLILLGCTAVEDALQAEVPATIRAILKAGIKLWMLTGDKLETAINIGKTCGLISNITEVLPCSDGTLHGCLKVLSEFAKKKGKKMKEQALVIEGGSLEIILFDPKDREKVSKYPEFSDPASSALAQSCRSLFLDLSSKCSAVICCRVTPGQKREVVKMMKKEQNCVSLAVGDGANDVSMILEADVGIGIYGEEGMQAVQASDYSIGEFRFLWELLLVHGRFNYLRVSEMILYFFYKNIVFTLPQFFFAFFCGFSGKSVYDDWYISLYNTIFTAAPLMSRALFEKDIMVPKRLVVETEEDSMVRALLPCVYSLGRENEIFTGGNFSIWLLTGVLHSVLVFFIPLYAVQAGIIDVSGHNADFWVFSITSFTCIVFLVNVRIALYSRVWTGLHVVSIVVLSIVLYLMFMIVYDFSSPTPSRGSVFQIFSTPYFYVILLAILMISLVFDAGLLVARKVLKPTKSEVLMEYSITSYTKKRLNREAMKNTEVTIN